MCVIMQIIQCMALAVQETVKSVELELDLSRFTAT